MSENLAYLAGAISDGCLVKRKIQNRYDIQFYQKNRGWLENSIIPRIREFGSNPKIYGPYKNCYYLKFGNKKLYKNLERQKIMDEADKKLKIIFIRAFWDAEGSCPHVEKYLAGERKRNKIPPQIGFHQNGFDKVNLLEKMKLFIESNGIKCSKLEGPFFRMQSNKPEFRFWIYGKHRIKSFIEIFQPEHPDKKYRSDLLVGLERLSKPHTLTVLTQLAIVD